MISYTNLTDPQRLLDGVSRERLADMRAAADDMIAVLEEAAEGGHHVLLDVLATAKDGTFTQWEHYPPGDVHDKETGAVWFYHAHAVDEDGQRPWEEHGHFHLFVYSRHLGADAEPIALPKERDEEKGGLCHLAAVSFDLQGAPVKIFTTNRWVAAEWMYRAQDVIPLIDRFVIGKDDFSLTSRWLMAALRLYRPQIEWALRERDELLAHAADADPDGFAEDKAIEVTSAIDFDLAGQIDAIEAALD